MTKKRSYELLLTPEECSKTRQNLVASFAALKKPEDLERAFSDVFTASELRNITLRWRLMEMLHEGMTQRAISAKLGISLCKITRGSHMLKAKGSIVRRMIGKI